MAEWTESYRGVVSAWECDVVEHFTIAYYFEKFADATRNFIEMLSDDPALAGLHEAASSRIVTIFQHELRGGAAYHILSAITSLDHTTLVISHQVIDTASGRTGAWVCETMSLPPDIGPAAREKLAERAVAWTGPEIPARSEKPKSRGALTARDRVKPWELDEDNRMSLSDHVHRFSGAGGHLLTSIGMNGNYMQSNRRGFSTFLLDLEIYSPANLGERIDVHTAIAHLGNTSLRYVHRMSARDGREIASMVQAGVQLDLDARRPTAFPPEIREAIGRHLSQA